MMQRVNGKQIASQIIEQLAAKVKQWQQHGWRQPCLAVIVVGDDPASLIYVRNKKRACGQAGIDSLAFSLPETTSQAELMAIIERLNCDAAVDGILVQLPLPSHLNSKQVIDAIAPTKDVDGFHRYNFGSLAQNNPQLCPCTPHGIMYLLDKLQVNYFGTHAVILGSSNIVGRPMAFELLNRGATVTICNSKTKNLAQLVAGADIVVAAIGKPQLVKGSWFKPGAIAIDVGINRLADGSLCGDIEYNAALERVAHITPVPGGVGPMTIAMLLQNTLTCYQLNQNKNLNYE